MSEKKRWPLVETYVSADGLQLIFELKDAYGQTRDTRLFTHTISCVLDNVDILRDYALDEIDPEHGTVRLMYGFTEVGDMDCQIKLENGVGELDFTEPFTIRVNEVI